MGIDVLVPDVNRSVAEFAPDRSGRGGPSGAGDRLRAGRGAQRGREPGRADRGRARRQRALRRHLRLLRRGSTRSSSTSGPWSHWSRAGAFDSLGHPRQGLCLVLEEIVDRTLERRREQDLGITSLFAAFEEEQADPGWGGAKVAIPDTEFDKAQRLAFEKEMLGLYVSDHPLMGFEAALARHTDCTLSDMREDDTAVGDRSPVRSVGRRGDRPAALLHEEGRPDGPLRARGPAGGHGGLRLPQDHGRVRRAHRERRHPGRAGPARHPGGGAQDRLHGGLPAHPRAGPGGPAHHAAARAC